MDVKCVIVDDDIISTEIIKSYIDSIQGIEIIAICDNAVSAFDVLQHKQVDLVFLDIEMPKLSGIEFIKTLKLKQLPRFIIASSNRDFAIEGYELDVLDYIVKPVHFERFLRAINKYYQYCGQSQLVINSIPSSNAENKAFIYVKENKKIHKIYLKNILYIESLKNYCKVVTPKKSVVTKQSIAFFEEMLPKNNFIRVHRSFLVSLQRIESFTATEMEIAQQEIPIGRSYKLSVMNSLNYHDKLD